MTGSKDSMPEDIHSSRSSHREALLEHLFAGEVMKRLWLLGVTQLEVLKPQVDDSGYDLVLETNSVVRHIQLKSSFRGSTVRRTNINTALAAKPSGCVVFVWFDRVTLELGPFLFFGGPPGRPLPDLSDLKTARHTKGNAAGIKNIRPHIRTLPLARFKKVASVDDLVQKLFGPLQPVPSARAGWAEAARAMAERGEDRLLDAETPIDFDETE